MHVTLLLPGALLPREVVDALAEPLAQSALATVLGRGEVVGNTETAAPAHLAWLAEHLFHGSLPLVTAPYAYAALAGTVPGGILWHADPVHLEPARDHLVLTPLVAPPSDDEAAALIDAADTLAADMDARVLRAENRWFVQCGRLWDLHAEPLVTAMGQPLPGALPQGADARQWSRLLTEIQMTWHAHPVNEAREARGEQTVNSLWLHGGGAWSPLERGAFSAVLADAAEWRGAAHAAAMAGAPADAAPSEGALIVRDDLLVSHLLQDWSGWMAALRGFDDWIATLARSSELDVVLAGGAMVRRLRIRPSDRLKFWRARRLHQVLSE